MSQQEVEDPAALQEPAPEEWRARAADVESDSAMLESVASLPLRSGHETADRNSHEPVEHESKCTRMAEVITANTQRMRLTANVEVVAGGESTGRPPFNGATAQGRRVSEPRGGKYSYRFRYISCGSFDPRPQHMTNLPILTAQV